MKQVVAVVAVVEEEEEEEVEVEEVEVVAVVAVVAVMVMAGVDLEVRNTSDETISQGSNMLTSLILRACYRSTGY